MDECKVESLYHQIKNAGIVKIDGNIAYVQYADLENDPENDLFYFTWVNDDGNNFESINEDDLMNAEIVDNTIRIMVDGEVDFEITLFRLIQNELI